MIRTDGRHQVALALPCAAVFLDSMDLSLMGVAPPAIGRDLSRAASPWPAPSSAYGLRSRRPVPVPTA
ncbi:hypothetical protein [Nonomuraea sp. NPDC049625]|uniref:hypothetical protein n=1 Tax=Nonomuraea sp. NPDC049625 TaxID=3155775 RepID=UPI003422709C